MLVALVCVLAVLIAAVRRRQLAAHWALVAGFVALSVALAIIVARMSAPGAAVIGWSLVWAVPLAPLRAVGALREHPAFEVSVVLSLAAIAGTVACTAVIGQAATTKRWLGVGAAALCAFWPLFVRPVAGPKAWENGSWHVLVGLAAYTEPVSTFLVAAALALILAAVPTPLRLTIAGIALSLATLVKMTNGLLAAVITLVCLAYFGWRKSAPLVAGGLVFLPVLFAYWPLGYPEIKGPTAEKPAFVSSVHAAAHNWLDSLVFSPRTLAVLVPLAVLGTYFIRSRLALWLLVLPVLVNAVFYTAYAHTAEHPRFLYVSLPAVFVLWTAGASGIVLSVTGWLRAARRSETQTATARPARR